MAFNIFGGKVFTEITGQWQPTLTAHDPNPPITLLDPAAATTLAFIPERMYPTPMTNLGSGLGAQ